MHDSTTADHPDLAGLDEGATVRLRVDDELIVGEVDDVRHHEEGEITGHAVTVIEDGYRGDVWDVEAEYDPRDGWTLAAHERVYSDAVTEFATHEDADVSIERVDPGIDPDRLDPGVTVEVLDGDHYRVVIPPWEREYDAKALAYNLDSTSNVCERFDPAEVVGRVA